MLPTTTNQYRPDTVSPPGASLADLIADRGMGQSELARRMGRPRKTINEIVHGKAEITGATALELERVLGVPAAFWLARERHFREYLARHRERRLLGQWRAWADQFPVNQMVKRGWIEPVNSAEERASALLKFFGVASPTAWRSWWDDRQAAFRRSGAAKVNAPALAAWLRRSEIEAGQESSGPFNVEGFRSALGRVRALTLAENVPASITEARRLLQDAGVTVVLVQELSGAPVSGATWWASGTRAVIALTLRYKTDDQLWFSLFHEAHHVVERKTRKVILDISNGEDHSESMANAFASEFLIPSTRYERFVSRGDFSCTSIEAFGVAMRIAPSIVVGRLQHDGHIPYTRCNHLKRRLKWAVV